MRLVDRDWTVAECLQVMEDLDHLEKDGQWKNGIPKWTEKLCIELSSFAGSAAVMMTAYEKSAKAFRIALADEKVRVDQLVTILKKFKHCSHGCAGRYCGHHKKFDESLVMLQPELARKIRE